MSSLAQKNGNDRVYTPPPLARAIVQHFKPEGVMLEPCAGPIGKQPFVDALLDYDLAWYEIDEGSDFLASNNCVKFDWVVTNPPWSQLRAFLKKSMEVSDNVVLLCLTNALFYNGRQDDIATAGFGIREIARIRQPRKPWPQTGFMLSANWLQRGWTGDIRQSEIPWSEFEPKDFWG